MNSEPDGPKSAAEWDGQLQVRVAATEAHEWFDQQQRQRHYLGAGQPVGDYLRQVVERGVQAVAQLLWGPASYELNPNAGVLTTDYTDEHRYQNVADF